MELYIYNNASLQLVIYEKALLLEDIYAHWIYKLMVPLQLLAEEVLGQ